MAKELGRCDSVKDPVVGRVSWVIWMGPMVLISDKREARGSELEMKWQRKQRSELERDMKTPHCWL